MDDLQCKRNRSLHYTEAILVWYEAEPRIYAFLSLAQLVPEQSQAALPGANELRLLCADLVI